MTELASFEPDAFDPTKHLWLGKSTIRARRDGATLYLILQNISTKSRHYRTPLYEFFRKEMPNIRPRWGDARVAIWLDFVDTPPALDLDNLAKALLDSIKRFVIHDDMQVCELYVRRQRGSADRVCLKLAFDPSSDPFSPAQP